ncbi:MerR family transcriptional regulator [Brevibacillus laterosporus]|uniref:MerR family transcriptional regulator n=1 Tax=Brevibacillus laterosporus TaxID=1465 RepID=UPI0018F86CA7|nr:MerR family transcriptional regulator [Brevibacillus laterosporus]MBG9771550.1 MerR family transcriptional regulator [Brevibacillus laterosporus]
MTFFKIDEVTKQVGVTKRTLRYYEEIGLIKPPIRTEGKIRLYSSEDVRDIKKILEAREVLGFSLTELQHFISLKEEMDQAYEKEDEQASIHADRLHELFEQQVDMLTEKMRRMESFRQDLQHMLLEIDKLRQNDKRTT